MQKFWNWVTNESGTRTLYMDGIIASETWYADDITPEMFKQELYAGEGEVEIYLNSPGGDCFAASQIYTMLMEYPHNVTIKIDGIAASAASVIAMAGTRVLMAPTGILMIHNPLTYVIGDVVEMERGIAMLQEVKEGILNAYEIKTNLPRVELAAMMDAETWISAKRAVALGFADGILGSVDQPKDKASATDMMPGFVYSVGTARHALRSKLCNDARKQRNPAQVDEPCATPVAVLDTRLGLLYTPN